MKKYTIEAISRAVGGKLSGNPTIEITGVEEISRAVKTQLTFIGQKKYIKLWDRSGASAAIVNQRLDVDPGQGRATVSVADADLAMAQVLNLFAPAPPACEAGIHPAAVVDATASIGPGAAIGAGCYVGPGVVIGAGSTLYPNVTVLDHTRIGSQTVVWSGTVIRDRCLIGDHCIIHPNVTIGADGFGYRPSPDGRGLVKIPQIGTVEIGNGVEIGPGSCVDRGKFSATTIGDGTKIDNLVQIGHNCTLGRSCVMAGQAGLAGSVTLGDGVVMGGRSLVKDHVTVCAGARIGGSAGVVSDVPAGKTVLGLPAEDHRQTLRIWAAQKHLPDLVKQLIRK
ncbi:UDP-3-O-acylglucosamine N-acyltransferase [Desulfosarcina alkanivorans]|uniref:UDP-3-O-acylglucosamine N-acyltransferase n=1 Tax=Desulfosarcina alkanivorans TaxID=571177 RepID=A0A5K7YWE4_9BACT|nr:UDP-3-O-(3-hydroxymyristoyl)glucosamine N-acyltransferase [Desulfosarcina alkanivorans]BBO70624.1 UDP-3-O-acylglucosamine N-acyltransferase [Desulfosarcina alkanivorans]